GGLLGVCGVPRVDVIAAVGPGARRTSRTRARREEEQLSQARETTAAVLQTLQEEVRSLRRLIGDQQKPALPAGLDSALHRLRAQEIPEAECYELVASVLQASEPADGEDPQRAREERKSVV